MNKAFTQKYKTYRTANGFRFTFCCDLCEKSFDTKTITTYSFAQAFQQAQAIAKLHFNKCHKCNKWVCDEHYNENVMLCIECKPKNGKTTFVKISRADPPLICRKCGFEIETGNCFCIRCGNRI